MITNSKFRHMTTPEKMKYFLSKLTEDLSHIQKEEIVEEISKLAKGVDPKDFLTKFELKGEFKPGNVNGKENVAPSIVIDLGDEKTVTIDINDIGRKWFKDPKPVEATSPRSILPQDELNELNSNG